MCLPLSVMPPLTLTTACSLSSYDISLTLNNTAQPFIQLNILNILSSTMLPVRLIWHFTRLKIIWRSPVPLLLADNGINITIAMDAR